MVSHHRAEIAPFEFDMDINSLRMLRSQSLTQNVVIYLKNKTYIFFFKT